MGNNAIVYDLHAHPVLKMTLFGKRFWRPHFQPRGTFFPILRTDFRALRKGNVRCLLSTVYVPERGIYEATHRSLCWIPLVHRRLGKQWAQSPEQAANGQLDLLEDQVAETRRRFGEVVVVAKNYAEMKQAVREDKIVLVHAMEGAHHLGGDLGALERFAARGVAYLIIAHFCRNEAGGCVETIPEYNLLNRLGLFRLPDESQTALTEWGFQLIERMWEIGVIVT